MHVHHALKSSLKAPDKPILHILCMFANPEGLLVLPKVNEVAFLTGVSPKTASRSIKSLATSHILEIMSDGGPKKGVLGSTPRVAKIHFENIPTDDSVEAKVDEIMSTLEAKPLDTVSTGLAKPLDRESTGRANHRTESPPVSLKSPETNNKVTKKSNNNNINAPSDDDMSGPQMTSARNGFLSMFQADPRTSEEQEIADLLADSCADGLSRVKVENFLSKAKSQGWTLDQVREICKNPPHSPLWIATVGTYLAQGAEKSDPRIPELVLHFQGRKKYDDLSPESQQFIRDSKLRTQIVEREMRHNESPEDYFARKLKE